MTAFALVDATILAGSTDLTGQSNEVSLEASVDALDATVFGSGGWRSKAAGLRSATSSVKGFFAAGDLSLPDDSLFAALGVDGIPYTVSPNLPAVGGLAYLMGVSRGSYKWGGQIGELLPFESACESDSALVRGQYAVTAPAKTATGTGTALNLGGVPAGSRLYAGLHVLAASGTASPTLTVSVKSDDASGFPSPTTQGTFTAATGRTSQLLKLSPAAAETWFRVDWTITGTTPSFLFLVSLGIGPA